MKVFGIELSRKRRTHEKVERLMDDPIVAMALMALVQQQDTSASSRAAIADIKPSGRIMNSIRTIGRANPTARIIYPEPNDPNDPWEVQRLKNLVDGVEKMFVQGWFSVCLIDKAVDEFKLSQTPRSREALRKLNLIHCVHFDKMVPGLFETIPDLITLVLTEGRFPQPVEEVPRLSHEG